LTSRASRPTRCDWARQPRLSSSCEIDNLTVKLSWARSLLTPCAQASCLADTANNASAAGRRLPPRPHRGGCGGHRLAEVAGRCRRRLDRRAASRRSSAAAGPAAALRAAAGGAAAWSQCPGSQQPTRGHLFRASLGPERRALAAAPAKVPPVSADQRPLRRSDAYPKRRSFCCL
jgi:hypothetical protein